MVISLKIRIAGKLGEVKIITIGNIQNVRNGFNDLHAPYNQIDVSNTITNLGHRLARSSNINKVISDRLGKAKDMWSKLR